MMYKLSLLWTLDRWKWQLLFLISSLREHCSFRSKRAQGVYWGWKLTNWFRKHIIPSLTPNIAVVLNETREVAHCNHWFLTQTQGPFQNTRNTLYLDQLYFPQAPFMCYHPSSSLFQEVGFCRENYPIYRTSFVGQNRQTLLVLEGQVKKKSACASPH